MQFCSGMDSFNGLRSCTAAIAAMYIKHTMTFLKACSATDVNPAPTDAHYVRCHARHAYVHWERGYVEHGGSLLCM